MDNLIYSKNLPCKPEEIYDHLAKDSIFAQLKWKAYGIHESFKKPDAHSRWYPAFIKVSKAAESSLDKYSSQYEKESNKERSGKTNNDIVFRLFKPIVILDGILAAASLDRSGDIALEE